MTVQTSPHLNFRGDAHAALEFYRSVFGGDLAAVSYRQAGADHDPADADKVMWGQVAAPNGFRIMAFDVPSSQPWDPGTIPFFVSVRGMAAEEITTFWDKLREGATIVQPIGPSGWSPLYGMLKDRFGVTWVLDVALAMAEAVTDCCQ